MAFDLDGSAISCHGGGIKDIPDGTSNTLMFGERFAHDPLVNSWFPTQTFEEMVGGWSFHSAASNLFQTRERLEDRQKWRCLGEEANGSIARRDVRPAGVAAAEGLLPSPCQ